MSNISITAEVRTELGKGSTKSLRASGQIPAVVYGKNDETIYVSIDEKVFEKSFSNATENSLIDLTVGKEVIQVIIKDSQFNQLQAKTLHLDFLRTYDDVKLTTKVQVSLVGRPVGVASGGSLEKILNKIKISCLPKDLPEAISIDVVDMKIGESFHVKQIKGYDTVEFINPENVICQIVGKVSANDDEETTEEEAAE